MGYGGGREVAKELPRVVGERASEEHPQVWEDTEVTGIREEEKEERAKEEVPKERVEAKGTRGTALRVECRATRRVSQRASSTKGRLQCRWTLWRKVEKPPRSLGEGRGTWLRCG